MEVRGLPTLYYTWNAVIQNPFNGIEREWKNPCKTLKKTREYGLSSLRYNS
jgi:hypothetical protein